MKANLGSFSMRYLWVCMIAIILFGFQNCSYVGKEQTDLDSELSKNSMGVEDSADQLEKAAMSVLKTKCASCHNPNKAEGGIDFITDINSLKYYRLVVPGEPQLSPLYEVISHGEMPPAGPLEQAQVQAIYDWIYKGLVGDQGGVTLPGATSVGLSATWSSIYANIIKPKCLGCHSATNSGGGVNLSTYVSTMNTVQPGNPLASDLYVSTNSGRMPRNGIALSSAQVSVIKEWITNGAPNN